MKIQTLEQALSIVPESITVAGQVMVPPQSVREAEARWILYKELRFTQYPSSQVKVYSTRVQDNGVLICTDCAWGIFPNDIENLGGVIAVQDMLTEGPGALWRWVEENRK